MKETDGNKSKWEPTHASCENSDEKKTKQSVDDGVEQNVEMEEIDAVGFDSDKPEKTAAAPGTELAEKTSIEDNLPPPSELETKKTEKRSKKKYTYKQSEKVAKPKAPQDPEEIPVKHAYEVLMKVLEGTRLGDKAFSSTVTSDSMMELFDHIKPIFMSQASCIEIEPPLFVCGDIHGQFADLLRIFDRTGFPHRSNYLFLGDYVDRGKHSIETITLLFCYKIIFPNHFFLLRGNHECPTINKVYGFYDECMRRFNAKVWEGFQNCFATMPLTGIIGDRILCMHGGLSPKLKSIDQLRAMKRPNYQPESPSLEIDVLWSDPSNFAKGWTSNQRGVSYVFGQDACKKSLTELGMDLCVRAHQVVQDGYEFFAHRRLVTLFSAPYYCGQFDNAAAVLSVADDMVCSFIILRPKRRIAKKQRLRGLQQRH